MKQYIVNRFFEELKEIRWLVDYLDAGVRITEHDISAINTELARTDLPLLQERQHKKGIPFSCEELIRLEIDISNINPRLFDLTYDLELLRDRLGENDDFNNYKDDSTFDQFVSFFEEAISGNLEPGEWIPFVTDDQVWETLANELIQYPNLPTNIHPSGTIDSIDDLIKKAANHSRVTQINNVLRKLSSISMSFHNIRMEKKLQYEGNGIGLFRQAFLLLMTIFDATIGDLVEKALRSNFFSVAAYFGKQKQKKYTLAEIVDLEKFQNDVVDCILSESKLSDYLSVLFNPTNKNLYEESVSEHPRYDRLVEIINRRNAHVHNRGKVDQKYLDKSINNLRCNANPPPKSQETAIDHTVCQSPE